MEQKFVSASGKTLQYLRFVPEKEGKLPLVLYIHGAGSRGEDLAVLRDNPALGGILAHFKVNFKATSNKLQFTLK